MPTTVLAGSTGLVGANILTTLLSLPKFTSINAYTRKKLPNESPKLQPIESTDSESWPKLFPAAAAPSSFLSALGTTKAQAGSFEAQRKIDFDLNLELAKAAKAAGVQAYVLISAAGASSTSMMPYSKMKGELEDEVKKLGFEYTVILRPGLIVGERQSGRLAEQVLQRAANLAGSVSGGALKNFWAQDATVIARAAVNAGIQCIDAKREPGVWLLPQADIVRLGQTEWVEEKAT